MLERSNFKATSTKSLKALKEKEDEMIGSRSSEDFIEIKEGSNKIRLAPKFPGEEEFYIMAKRTWVPFEKDDGEITRVTVFDSKLHGGTKLDIIDEYVKFCKANLDQDSKRDKEKLSIVLDWKKGLVPQTLWYAYGWKLVKDQEPKFGIFEFKKSIRDALCSIAIIEDEDEAVEIDPFTDLDEGLPIIVKYDPSAKEASKKYSVQLSKHAYPVDDEMFEQLSRKKPLTELYRNNYTLEDFEKALDGIKIFDIEYEIDLFDEDEFQEIVKEVKKQYKSLPKQSEEDEDEDEDEDEAPKKPLSGKSKQSEEDEDEDEAPKKPLSGKSKQSEEEDEKPKKTTRMSIEELRERLKNKKESRG